MNTHIYINTKMFHAALKHLCPNEFKIFCAILEYTHGYGKETEYISDYMLSKLTWTHANHIQKQVKRLESMKIITVDRQPYKHPCYTINRDVDSWTRVTQLPCTK